mmetsp:Transcript_113980/g.322686  ORF Transcript_113980/g.322686 Transcript_113980/m.322686 type:complete len:207 (-) Transcript_113980:2119-2739(-)
MPPSFGAQLLRLRSFTCMGHISCCISFVSLKFGFSLETCIAWNSCGQCDVVTPRLNAWFRWKIVSSEHQAAGVMHMYATALMRSWPCSSCQSSRSGSVLQCTVLLSQSIRSPARAHTNLGALVPSVRMGSFASRPTKFQSSGFRLYLVRMSPWKRCDPGTTTRPPVSGVASLSVMRPWMQWSPRFRCAWSTWCQFVFVVRQEALCP